jgi:beta-galactosidase
MRWSGRRGIVCVVGAGVLCCAGWSVRSAAQPLVIDASAANEAVPAANYAYETAEARSPDGHVLGLNAEYLTRDGRPWLPVMGEMHYSRVPESEWEDEILKMKSAGVEIVSAYIIWIHHEEVESEWDWAGQKDLQRFVQLCAKHGMYVWVRVGPWSHAEVRNGGFPDWLLKETSDPRSNDPAYLHYVDLYYKQIGAQLKGLMWSEGGPVVGVQLENEYSRRGTGHGVEHILKLKEMARDAGLRVPFYTETGWDNAAIAKGAVLTVDGGYPDAPWDASIEELPPNGVYAFRFGRRSAGDMGAIDGGGAVGGGAAVSGRDTPWMTAEMGGGMQVTYHRRPVVTADDIVAMMPAMLGSGVNLYGTYMFHGGENPDGKLTTLQESLATHYANDLPVKTYDFEAPLGEFGDERPSLIKMKVWNYFLNDFGAELAPMQVRRPETVPAGPKDFLVARVSVRSAGGSGFLFVNNHVREYAMPPRAGFQVEVKLPEGKTAMIPEKPVTLPADAYFVWPFGMDLDGLKLRFATAQPLAKLGMEVAPVYVFFAQPGIKPEFVVEDTPGLKVDQTPAGVTTARRDGAVWVRGLSARMDSRVRFTLSSGRAVTLLLLSQEDAEEGWKLASGGGATDLLVTPQQAFVDGGVVTLEAMGPARFGAKVVSADGSRLWAVDPGVRVAKIGGGYSITVEAKLPGVARIGAKQTKAAGEVAPLPAGFKPSAKPRVVAAAPTEEDWSRAAEWRLDLPKGGSTDDVRRFLRITYVGDVARLSVGGRLLTDNFADGRPWLVGLSRFEGELKDKPLTLSIYPLRRDAPIFFEPGYVPVVQGRQADRLESVEMVTEYRVRVRLEVAAAEKPQ